MGKVFNMTGGGGGGIKLAAIAIITGPTKTTYTAGETFDPAGMVIEATYTNGAKLEATGFSFTPSTPLTDGTTAVTIRYTEGGVTKTADVPITVIHRLTGIRVTNAPDKTVYEYGESFSTTGMVVTAEYSDGYTETVEDYTYSPTAAFAALGAQTITLTYSDGKHTVSNTLTVTVERQTISAVPAQSGTLTYTGSAQSPTWTGYDSEKMTIGGDTSATDAGDYEATFTPTAYYRWPDGTTTAQAVQWSIAKATVSAPSQSGTLTYTGTEQSPVWSGYDETKLTIGGTTSGTNAGSYSATFTPKDNYQWSDGTQDTKTVAWTIGKAVITTAPSQSGSLTYTGGEQSPSWSNYDSSKMTLGGTTAGTNAGTYNATFTPLANYQWSDGTTDEITVAWTIGKAAGSVSVSPTSLSLTATAKTGTVTVTRTGDGAITATSSATGVATVSVSGTTVTVTGVATGSATVTVNVAEGTNHLAASATVSVAVQLVAVGDIWTLTSTSGAWTVPATGKYDIELHGGGGGGGGGGHYYYSGKIIALISGGGGGGSGQKYSNVTLTAGTSISYSVGSGGSGGTGSSGGSSDRTAGTAGNAGGTTTFGTYSVAGGSKGGYAISNLSAANGGSASGSLGAAGSAGTKSSNYPAGGTSVSGGAGGQGNSSNTAQTYGDGGAGGGASSTSETAGAGSRGSSGNRGAIIITYKGT